METVDNHIIIKMDGLNVLLNTGAPRSISAGGELKILGQNHKLDHSYPGMDFKYLEQEIGIAVDAMLGGDILQHICFVVNWPEREIKFSQSPVNTSGIVVPLDFIAGIPEVSVIINGKPVRVLFVTGANLSYLTPELLEGANSEGEVKDFYPGLGRYSTSVYRVPFQLNKNEEIYIKKFAGMPEQILFLLRSTDMSGIISTEIFSYYPEIHFNCSHKFLVFRKGGM